MQIIDGNLYLKNLGSFILKEKKDGRNPKLKKIYYKKEVIILNI